MKPKQSLPEEVEPSRTPDDLRVFRLPPANQGPTKAEGKPSLASIRKMPLSNPSEEEHFRAWTVFNRDLSQLEFFKRILEEATDETVPLLERLKFLAVFSSNLDEFFMVRISGLMEMLDIKDFQPLPGELTPAVQLSGAHWRSAA